MQECKAKVDLKDNLRMDRKLMRADRKVSHYGLAFNWTELTMALIRRLLLSNFRVCECVVQSSSKVNLSLDNQRNCLTTKGYYIPKKEMLRGNENRPFFCPTTYNLIHKSEWELARLATTCQWLRFKIVLKCWLIDTEKSQGPLNRS